MAEFGILEPQEVAELLKLRQSTLLDLSRRGVLPAFKIGKHWRYHRGDLGEEWMIRRREALAWNWLIAGTDAHAKNYSLLIAANDIRLAPLYDVASALPHGTHERKLRFAMKIGGDYRVYPWRNTWPAAAAELGLDPEALAAQAPDAFADAASADDVSVLGVICRVGWSTSSRTGSFAAKRSFNRPRTPPARRPARGREHRHVRARRIDPPERSVTCSP